MMRLACIGSILMNSLNHPKLSAKLAQLHQAAKGDAARWQQRREAQKKQPPDDKPDPLIRLGEFYIPVSEQEGELLFLLARAKAPQLIVEFGASYGISTLYLAAAARATNGRVITTEVHPQKCIALRETFADAEVHEHVTLLEGDAQITLQQVQQPIDLLFLDGWKSLYLPIFELLRPHLNPGALVIADNISFAECQDYLATIQSTDSGLITQLIGDMALSCVL